MTRHKAKAIKWLLGIAAATSLVVYLLPSLFHNAGVLESRLSNFNWTFLLVAFLLSVVSRPVNAMGWRIVLATFGYYLRWRSVIRIWITSEVCRWLPGNVWHVGSRTAQAAERGIPVLIGIASVALELLLTIAASFILAVLGVFLYGSHWIQAKNGLFELFSIRAVGLAEVMLGIVVLAAAAFFAMRYLMPRKYAAFRERFAALRKNPPRPLPTFSCLVFYMFFVFLNGVAFYVTLKAVVPTSDIPLYAAITVNALAWIVGLIPLGAPAGLGVREAILVLELSAWLHHGDALMIAILWRFLLLAAELFCVLSIYAYPLLKHFARSWSGKAPTEPSEITRLSTPAARRAPRPSKIIERTLGHQFTHGYKDETESPVYGVLENEDS